MKLKRSLIVPWAALAMVAAATIAASNVAPQSNVPLLGDRIPCSTSGTLVPESGLTCGELVSCAAATLWKGTNPPALVDVAVYVPKPLPRRLGTPGPDGYLGVSTVGGGWVVVFNLSGGGSKQLYIYRPEGCR